jgi:hypothetical protein
MQSTTLSLFVNALPTPSTINNRPEIVNALVDQAATEDSAFTYTFAADSFNEPDAQVMTYSVTSTLPAWLSFDAAMRTLSGTPDNAAVGDLDVTISARDAGGLSAEDTFRITTANTNDAPTIANAIADQAATEDSAFSYTVPSNAFNDVDVGDTLTYSVTSALPGWLSFDATTRTFSGTPAVGDVGNLDVTLRATDSAGAFVEDVVRVTTSIVGTAGADTLAGGAGNQSILGLAGNDVIYADIAATSSSAAFEPDNVSGLRLWLDGADQSTLFSNTAGTTPITDGGSVARWNDKSGQGNHATDSTAGTSNDRPIWDADGLNNKGVLVFDGVNDGINRLIV